MGVLNILGSKYPVTPASFTLEWIVQHTVMPEVLCDKLSNLKIAGALGSEVSFGQQYMMKLR